MPTNEQMMQAMVFLYDPFFLTSFAILFSGLLCSIAWMLHALYKAVTK